MIGADVPATGLVFNSNTALILGTLITSVFGYLGIRRQTVAVRKEVQSSNGVTTGDTIQEMKAELHSVKEDLSTNTKETAAVAVAFGQHLAAVADMERSAADMIQWTRRHMADDVEHGRRQNPK